MEGEGGLDVDRKLRLITIKYFNRRLIVIPKINRCTAPVFTCLLFCYSTGQQNADLNDPIHNGYEDMDMGY